MSTQDRHDALPLEALPMTDRHLLDLYLDSALPATDRAALDQRLAAEPALAALLDRIRAERLHRAAALASWQPSEQDARRHAEALLQHLHAPVGRIGIWVRRFSAVAAAIALVAGAFAAGRATAPATTPVSQVASAGGASTPAALAEKPLAERPYTVVYWNSLGEPQVRQFANAPDVDAFVTDLESHNGAGQVASYASDENDSLNQNDSLSPQGSF